MRTPFQWLSIAVVATKKRNQLHVKKSNSTNGSRNFIKKGPTLTKGSPVGKRRIRESEAEDCSALVFFWVITMRQAELDF